MSLLTNTAAMVALQNLRVINSDLEDVQKQISTGLKISSAQDNAAIFSITTVMNSDVKGFEAISESLSLATATLGVALDASETVAGLLSDMKQHIVSAQEDNVDRATINDEVAELKEQIEGIVSAASFNGLTLVEGHGEISFLAALNRGSDDSVTASHISVDQHSLEQTAGTAVDDMLDAGLGYTSATGALAVGTTTAQTYDLLIDDAATFTANDVWSVAVTTGTTTTTVSYTVQDGDDHDDVATGLAAAVDGMVTGFTTATSGGGAGNDTTMRITSTSSNAYTLAVSVTSASNTGISDATAGVGPANDLVSSAVDTTIADGDTFTVGIENTATFNEGDVWEFIIGGQSITYETQAGDDHDAVATGINNAITAAGFGDITATVTLGGLGVDATIDITNNSGDDIEFKALVTEGNGGGLRNLADIDVSTALGARTALTAIEDLIDVAVNAAAAFGSSMSRIDIQVEFVSNFTDALRTGIGALVDADLEEASARLQSLQVQQQLGVQALSISTQSTQNILALFQN